MAAVLMAALAAGAAGCQLTGGTLTGGHLELDCRVPGWYVWSRPAAADHVYVSVVNATASTPLDLVVTPASPVPFPPTTVPVPPALVVRVWDGHASSGVVDVTVPNSYHLSIVSADGTSAPGEVSVLVNAIDAEGQPIDMGCPSPSPG